MFQRLKGKKSKELLEQLFEGSSVSNPIDILATGTAEQLDVVIDYCENQFTEIDAMAVIIGSPGLFNVSDYYDIIHKKIRDCKKPVFPVMPSIVNAKNEVDRFISKGNICFPDEVLFGNALGKVYKNEGSFINERAIFEIDEISLKQIVEDADNGYLPPKQVNKILNICNIPNVQEIVCKNETDCLNTVKKMNFPVVMKAIGVNHKSDVGGIILDINTEKKLKKAYSNIVKIKGVNSVLIQPMKKGIELFIGAVKEGDFGHLVLCGLGRIFVEILDDVQVGLVPVSFNEAKSMIKNLKSYKILQGARNQASIDEDCFADIIIKVSNLVNLIPEIKELDLNPLIGNSNEIIAVDARIKIEKT